MQRGSRTAAVRLGTRRAGVRVCGGASSRERWWTEDTGTQARRASGFASRGEHYPAVVSIIIGKLEGHRSICECPRRAEFPRSGPDASKPGSGF